MKFSAYFIRIAFCRVAIGAMLCAHGAEGVWYESFEGPDPSWKVVASDGHVTVRGHQRTDQVAHTGRKSEWIQIWGNNATYVFAEHPIGKARVIDDLRLRLWLRADRPGIELRARITLPASIDPRTQRPLTAILVGGSYRNVGRWQELRLEDLPTLLSRELRVLRTQFGPHVSAQGAYLDGLILNIYGGPGVTNVWIDDLDVSGYVPVTDVNTVPETLAATPRPPTFATSVSPSPPIASDVMGGARPADLLLAGSTQTGQDAAAWPGPTTASGNRRVELSGSVLLVDNRPFFPRAIQYRGEPLELLRQLGFNTLWLDQVPSAELLAEARRSELWIVCPPPPELRVDGADDPAAVMPFDTRYDRVLYWNLGLNLDEEQLPVIRRRSQQLRMADRAGRPLICHARSQLLAYSRAADTLLLDRQPLGTGFELPQYGNWIRRQPRLARPGTPVWTTIQTQLPAEVVAQMRLVDPTEAEHIGVQPEQIRLLVYQSVAAGSRGLLVLSDRPLSSEDPQTRQRAATLELLNLELQLVEPWAAGGTLVTFVETGDPQVGGALLRAERARLLMPLWAAPAAQFVPGQSAANLLQFTVPGLPESTLAYQLIPGQARPLRHKRVTGGTRITLDEFGLTDLVLLAHDPSIVAAMMQRSTAIGRRAAELHLSLATAKYQRVGAALPKFAARSPMPAEVNSWLLSAQSSLRRAEQQRAGRNYADSYIESARAMRALRLVERGIWERAVADLPYPTASPFAVAWATLPAHYRLTDMISASRTGPNLLPGGQFDRLDALVQSGWRNWQRAPSGAVVKVELSTAAGRGGGFGLALSARPENAESAPAAVEVPPILVSSPLVTVPPGQLVCIHGWVKMTQEITAGDDGLMIFDSIGGEPLAARIYKTAGWQRILLYRIVGSEGVVQLHIALTGFGEVHLDDFAVNVLSPPGTSAHPIAEAPTAWSSGSPGQ